MGRTKPKKKVNSKAKDLHSESKKAPSITSLLAKAQSLIEQCDYDLALRFISRILDQDPKNAEAKEMLGVALLETGEIEGAKQVRYNPKKKSALIFMILQAFQALLPPNPHAPSPSPPSAHLYLAQLSEDDPKLALQHYQAAVNILLVQLKGKDRADDENGRNNETELKANVVRALIGQVEIWMDPSYDLW